jgi:type II secretory pathway pseudopilin PulG
MNKMKKQSGVSIIGVLVIVALFSFFLTVMLRLVPSYLEGRSVRDMIQSVVDASTAAESLREINKKIQTTMTTNQVDAINPRDVKVYRDKGTIMIDARYEKRTKLFEGIDAVLMFDDLVFTIQ